MDSIRTDALRMEFIGRKICYTVPELQLLSVSLPSNGVIDEIFIRNLYEEYDHIQKPKLVFEDSGRIIKQNFHDFYNIGIDNG